MKTLKTYIYTYAIDGMVSESRETLLTFDKLLKKSKDVKEHPNAEIQLLKVELVTEYNIEDDLYIGPV